MNEQLAHQVDTVLFTAVRLTPGYRESDVDAFLDRLSAALRSGQPVDGLVRQAAFRTVRSRGYAMREVDDLLDTAVARAGDAAPSAAPSVPGAGPGWSLPGTAADPTSWSPPQSESDSASGSASPDPAPTPSAPAQPVSSEPVPSPPAAPPMPADAPAVGSVIQEQKGLLRRLLGR